MANQKDIDAMTAALHKALDDHFANRISDDPVVQDFMKLRTTVYQGVNTLCARCGQSIPEGSAVEDEGEYGSEEEGRVFLYCSVACREAH